MNNDVIKQLRKINKNLNNITKSYLLNQQISIHQYWIQNQQAIMYRNSNFMSSSIERSYLSTRKSTTQNSVVPNKFELSHLIDSSSLIFVQQSYIDHFASVNPYRDDLSKIKLENAALKEKMNEKEKQIDQLYKKIKAQQKEKDLIIQQYQNTIYRITQEIEIGKKNAQNLEQNNPQRKLKQLFQIVRNGSYYADSHLSK